MKRKLLFNVFVLMCLGFWSFSAKATSFNQYGTFSGVNSYLPLVHVPLNAATLSTDDLTIEAWIKTTQTTTGTIIGWKGTNGLMMRINGGKLQYGEDIGSWTAASSTNVVNSGNWTHVAVVRTGTSIKMYINGMEDVVVYNSGSAMHANPVCSTSQLNIGTINASNPNNEIFTGDIDEVRVWKIARTATELQTNQNSVLLGNETGLLAYFPLDGNGSNMVPLSYDVTYAAGNLNQSVVCAGSATSNLSVLPLYKLPAAGYTLEAWVKREVAQSMQTIIGFKNPIQDIGIMLRFTDGKLQLGEWVDNTWRSVTSTGVVHVGEWAHIACVRGATTASLFINGVKDGEATNFVSRTTSPNTTNINIGTILGTTTEFYKGAIDEVRIWSTLRTPEELLANKNIALDGTQSGLLGLYPLDNDGRNLANSATALSAVNVLFNSYVATALKNLNSIDITAGPNPFVDYVTINLPAAGDYVLTLLDASGKKVTSKTVHLTQPEKTKIDISDVAKGIYLLRVKKSGDLVSILKLIK